jgi:uncharacterized protein (TIGR00251 family)
MNMKDCMRVSGDSILLALKVLPGASRSEIIEVREGRLRVRIAAAAEDGKANAELRSFFAKLLGCPKKDIILQSGEKSRLKTIEIPGAYGEKLLGLGEKV